MSDKSITKIDVGSPVIYGTRFRTPKRVFESFVFVTDDYRLFWMDSLFTVPNRLENKLEVTSCTFCQIDNVNLVGNTYDVWFIVTYRYTKKATINQVYLDKWCNFWTRCSNFFYRYANSKVIGSQV